jgi:hypothetical protein
MGRTACTEPQCLCKGALYLYLYLHLLHYVQTQALICTEGSLLGQKLAEA